MSIQFGAFTFDERPKFKENPLATTQEIAVIEEDVLLLNTKVETLEAQITLGNLDGGHPSSIYLPTQVVSGGGPGG